jgi:glycosyltransferase involved in cell wall biosynthesis
MSIPLAEKGPGNRLEAGYDLRMANMTKRLSTKQVKVAVDLTPMLPGGANGGIKPAILEFIRALQQLPGPHFRFYFITAASTHHEVEAIATGRDTLMCVDWPEAYTVLTPTGFHKMRIDLFYAPFGMIRFPDCGIPIVAMVVDLLHRDFASSISEEERQWREEYFAETVRCAKRFQVISNYTGQRLTQHYGVQAAKMFRTYLPIQDRLNIPDGFMRPGNRYFFYPANFWPHKNHEVLLIAFQIYQQQAGPAVWDLVLTGSDDPRRRALQELAITLGIDNYVHFKGHVSTEELAHLFSCAGALVFPSLYEGFGIPPLEAMKSGLPVLTSESGSLREVVGDAALLVDPRNPIRLAEAMAKLAASERLRADLRSRGFQRAKCFSFQNEVTYLAHTILKLKPCWGKRIQRGLVLGLCDNCVWAQARATIAYRSFRNSG